MLPDLYAYPGGAADYERYQSHEREARERKLDRLTALDVAGADDPRVAAEIRQWRRHVVGLVAAEPAVAIHWLQPGMASTEIVGPNNATYTPGHRTIYAPPIVDDVTYGAVLHEIGHPRSQSALHQRSAVVKSRLQWERLAWTWARENALVWTSAMWADMVKSLESYVRGADATELREIVAIEKFCSREAFAAETKRRRQLALEAFERAHGRQRCEARRCLSGESASARSWGRWLCRLCAEDERITAAAISVRRSRNV